MFTNALKAKLHEGQPVFGTGLIGPADATTLRILAEGGVDWLFIDMEHGSLDTHQLPDVIQVATLLGMWGVVRVPNLEYPWVARALDTGSLAIMIPRVETSAQAEQALQWIRFPPEGVRGMGSPAYLGYRPEPIAEGLALANRETLVVLQIETVKAVENADAIAAIPGVDVLFIGPMDLSISLGRPGDVASDASHAQFRRVCQAAAAHGKAVGVVCRADQVAFYYDMGIRMFSVGHAMSHMAAGLQAARNEYRRQLGG
ncbi:MAG: HpcH/HpaI aldolase family protein [Anaerolineae bacterium]